MKEMKNTMTMYSYLLFQYNKKGINGNGNIFKALSDTELKTPTSSRRQNLIIK